MCYRNLIKTLMIKRNRELLFINNEVEKRKKRGN